MSKDAFMKVLGEFGRDFVVRVLFIENLWRFQAFKTVINDFCSQK